MRESKFRARGGFTLIEVLIIIVITAVVVSVAVVSAFKYKASQDLRLTLNELSALIRDTQRKSVTQEDGKRWGLRFENAESGKDRVHIFKGTSFASGTVTQSVLLRRGSQFGEPGPSSTRDIVFLPIEGSISPNKVITLNTGLLDGLFGDIIINLLGRVTTHTDTGLVGYWHLDEGSGKLASDASVNGNHGILESDPVWQSDTNCRAGGCLGFFGSSESVQVSVSEALKPQAFTLSYWVYMQNIDQSAFHIVNSDNSEECLNGFGIGTRDATFYFCVGNGDGKTEIQSGGVETQKWYHVAGVFNGKNTRLYINGEDVGNGDGEEISYENITNTLYLVYGENPDKFPFFGYLDEVRIYNRALSATEISNIYNDLK